MDTPLGYVFRSIDQLYANAPPGDHLLKDIEQKNVEKATKALVDGTDPNSSDPQTGNTALHLAVLVQCEVLVKLLIVFDANLTLKNKNDQTALDIAKDIAAKSQTATSEDIVKAIDDIFTLRRNLAKDGPKDQTQQPAACAVDGLECLMLSLDGGGIRGLVFVQVLIEMDKRRRELYRHSKEHLLSNFNWITGNSTGGIAALAFAAARTTVKHGRTLYFELKDKVLRGDPPFKNEYVDSVFQHIYGPTTLMSDIKEVNVSVMTTLATESPPTLDIMSNYGEASDKQYVWKAARATSSVPILFHPQDSKYLDGGLIANNPTTDAIIDMFKYASKENKKLKLKMVLSLGCGLDPPEPVEGIDFEPNKVGDVAARLMEKLGMHKTGKEAQELFLVLHNHKALLHLMKVISAQITQPNGEVLERSEFVCEILGAKLFRINPPLKHSVDFLTTDDTVLINMLYDVIYYMLKNCREIIDPVLECIYEH